MTRPLAAIVAATAVFGTSALGSALPVIAVTAIKSSVDERDFRAYTNAKAENFQNMLETQLTKINRFKIMERNRVDEVLSEQGLQEAFSTTGAVPNIEGVDYIVYGSITRMGTTERNVRTGGFASVKTMAEFGVDLKLVDAHTGEIRRAENVDLSLETGRGVRTGSFSSSNEDASPLSTLQRAVARRVAAVITESIFPVKVVAIENGEVYLNYGDAMFQQGDRLTVYREGRSFVDPDTGLSLGSARTELGTLTVTATTDRFSTATVSSGEEPEVGDLATITVGSDAGGDARQQEYLGRKI
ncbi:MAG: hypothetical protein F4X98_11015 [Gammaproteobacteria bacterium]|nr:hypothetical protein [Gammaproteobacteria bacterium]